MAEAVPLALDTNEGEFVALRRPSLVPARKGEPLPLLWATALSATKKQLTIMHHKAVL